MNGGNCVRIMLGAICECVQWFEWVKAKSGIADSPPDIREGGSMEKQGSMDG